MAVGFILLLLAIVIGLPLCTLISGKFRQTAAQRAEETRTDAAPWVYVTLGSVLTAAASAACAVIAFGFLLPGLGWIEKNALSGLLIWIPPARRSRQPAQLLLTSDVEASLMICAVLFSVILVGLFTLGTGLHRQRRRRT